MSRDAFTALEEALTGDAVYGVETASQIVADLRDGVRVLAAMTKNAPSYQRTVVPFADAHQEACQVLSRLQGHGFEEAS